MSPALGMALVRRMVGLESPKRLLPVMLVIGLAVPAASAEFVISGDPPVAFGVRGGLHVGLHPAAFDERPRGGPRGLLRIAVEHDGRPHLVNYIAVEPIVTGRRGYSELERSADGEPGKQMRVVPYPNRAPNDNDRFWSIEETPRGAALRFVLEVERFENGAQPRIEVTLFEALPLTVRFRTFAGPRCAKMESLVLTATMGNQLRCRDLWLAETCVSARDLFHRFESRGFARCDAFPISTLHRTTTGDVVAVITPDEHEPSETMPAANGAWHSPLPWLAQYWRKPADQTTPALSVRINGRRTYWGGDLAIPGGASIENFDLNEPFVEGQESWFGVLFEDPATRFKFAYGRPPRAPVSRKLTEAQRTSLGKARRTLRALTNGRFKDGWTGWERSRGAHSFRLYDEAGTTRLTTHGPDGDANMGRVWQHFHVPPDAEALRLHVHGGDDPKRLRVALWHREKLHRWITGRDHHEPFEVRWDLRPLRGETVTLEVRDYAVGPWGFVGIHGIELLRSGRARP